MTVLNDVETWNNVHYCNFLNTSSFDNCLCSQLGCFMAVSCMLYLHHIPLSLWIGTSVFGLFMSSVFPSTLAFAQKYIDVTGKTRANELNAHKTGTNNIHKIRYLWELVLVCVGVAVERTMYQRKVDVDMLNAVKSVWLTFRALALRQSKDGMNSYYN